MAQITNVETVLSAQRSLRSRISNLTGYWVPIKNVSSFSEDIKNIRDIYESMEERINLATVSIPDASEVEARKMEQEEMQTAQEKMDRVLYLERELGFMKIDLDSIKQCGTKRDVKSCKKEIKEIKKELKKLTT